MKAIVINSYGGPEVLELKEIPEPGITETDLLVRIHAASINAGDYFAMRGRPLPARFSVGFPKPDDHVLGWDLAGRVESVGAKVTGFQVGDEIYASYESSLAEFSAVPADKAAKAPANLSPEEAASIPSAGSTALQALRDQAHVQPGMNVLINGASGGVGTFAVQIAKSLGAEVTGVCSTRNIETVRSLGADHVVDYTKEDFTKGDEKYDLILDNVGNRSFADCRRALTPGGFHLPNSGHAGLGFVMKAFFISAFHKRHLSPFLSVPNSEYLNTLKELVETNKMRSIIDKTFPLSETGEAMRYLEEEHAQGKVVVTI